MQAAVRVFLALFYLVALLWPFRPFAPRFDTHVIGDHGDALLQHLHCSWQWQALGEGRFSEILDLPTMAPYSSGLAFGEPLIGIALPFAPVYLATGSTAAAFNAAVVASFVLLALGTFLLARELLRSTPAGLLAAMLVGFTPWRLHYLSAANVLTLHYAVFGLWLLARWRRKAELWTLLGAALLFHLQLVTSAQSAVPAIYLACVWLGVEWAVARLRTDRRRLLQLVGAGALFLVLSLPWLAFFDEAFAARSSLPPLRQMAGFSKPLPEMARLVGAFGLAGALAVLSLLGWLLYGPLSLRRTGLPRGAATALLGLGLGALLLFAVGRGPYLGLANDPTPLPGYFAAQFLPLAGMFRAPIRLITVSPLVIALFAASGMALLERALAPARGSPRALALRLLPLALVASWPRLDAGMAAPIAQRPLDLALAQELAKLPEDAQLLALPLELGLEGAPIDERVLVHRRRQIGGFASVVPLAFRQAALRLGDWPRGGLEMVSALGASHLVVPLSWWTRHRAAATAAGYSAQGALDRHAILRAPGPAPTSQTAGWRLEAPARAARGRWVTLALRRDDYRFEPRAQRALTARWRQGERVSRVRAMALLPGVAGPDAAVRVHVPTPDASGRHQLRLAFRELEIETWIELESHPTSFELPIHDAQIQLARGFVAPERVRAGAAFGLEVELEASAGPILLASSLHPLPIRRGETVALVQYRSAEGERDALRLPAGATLARDLAPGERARLRWTLQTPRRPGLYDVRVRLIANGVADQPMPWRPLLRDVEVAYD